MSGTDSYGEEGDKEMIKELVKVVFDESVLSGYLEQFNKLKGLGLKDNIVSILLFMLLIPALLLDTAARGYILIIHGAILFIKYLYSKIKELVTKW